MGQKFQLYNRNEFFRNNNYNSISIRYINIISSIIDKFMEDRGFHPNDHINFTTNSYDLYLPKNNLHKASLITLHCGSYLCRFEIVVDDDDWFYLDIDFDSSSLGGSDRYNLFYRCDQIDGLCDCIIYAISNNFIPVKFKDGL